MLHVLRQSVFLLVIVFAAAASAETETIVVPMPDGEVRLHFDSRAISEAQVQGLALIGPHMSRLFASLVWDSFARDEETGPVETPDLADAEVTLSHLAEALEDIAYLSVPAELEAPRASVRREGAFYVCLRRAQLAYYGGDDHALAVECAEIDAPTSCWEIVVEAPLFRTAEKRYELAGFAWRDCMTERFRERLESYPLANWHEFLRIFGVEEEIIEHEGC